MRVVLGPEIENRLRAALRKGGRREIGGMVFAEQLAPDHFCVVDFSLDTFSGSHTTFRRDPRAHRQTLEDFFERTGQDFRRFNYLGEWHSHPSFSPEPSLEDIRTMTDIVDDQSSPIAFAVLLIVRLRWRLWLDHSLTIFARGQAPRAAQVSRRIVWI
jgi:integrative and conjugative element protein (TIGR02256 family)